MTLKRIASTAMLGVFMTGLLAVPSVQAETKRPSGWNQGKAEWKCDGIPPGHERKGTYPKGLQNR
jgi:hypothetical protein